MLQKILLSALLLSLFVVPSVVIAQETETPDAFDTFVEEFQENTQNTTIVPDGGEEQEFSELYFRGKVLKVVESETPTGYLKQQLLVEITSGEEKGDQVEVENVISGISDEWRQFDEGDKVVLTKTGLYPGQSVYYVVDYNRLPALLILVIAFLALAVLFSGKRGMYAIGGLALSVFVLMLFIVPQLANGANPIVIGGIGSILIAGASLYVAHGFNKKTTIALVAMMICIGVAILLAWIAVEFAQLYGVGSEEAYSLQFASDRTIPLRGLFLASIIIGALGVLDDVTTALVATVHEIYEANNSLTFSELYTRGKRVGLEHIASLINTLVFAYAGTSLPLLLLFTLDYQPYWVTLNGQFLAEEIVRTLVGSMALLCAVPITTLLAAGYYSKEKQQ